MKYFIFITVFLALSTFQIQCGTIKKQLIKREVPEGAQHKQSIIEKLKDKTEEFADKVQEGADVVVQKVKTGFQEAKCKLHQVGEKIYHHTHEQNPCGEDVDDNKPEDHRTPVETETISNPHNKPVNENFTSGKANNEVFAQVPSGRSILNQDGSKNEEDLETDNEIRGRRIFAPTNCPTNFVADKRGHCRERF